MNRCQPSKPVIITNSFERLKEELDDTSTNVRVEKIKLSPIFAAIVDNFSSLSQLKRNRRWRI
jgi:hypothetical protein